MKKNIITLIVLTLCATMFAQYVNVDFEPGSLGAEWGWTVGENGDNPPLEFVANPDASGINNSANSAMFTARASGQPWALCFSDDMEPFEFTANNTTVTIMMYKPVVSNVAIKFEGTSAPVELQVANTLTNQWEELTFDFSGSIGNTYSRLIVIPDFEARTADNVLYFDNIQLPETNVAPIPEPTTAAPIPMHSSDAVISIFSNAYTDNPVDTWSADWDNADVSDVQIAGDDVKLYSNLSFAGIEFTSNTIDATAMEYFHLDFWTPDTITGLEELKIKLVDFGADGMWSGGDDSEYELSFLEDIVIPNSWVSLDILLSDFTNLLSTEHLAQLVISGDPNTLYVDNIYFHDGNTGPVGPTVAAPTPTAPAEAVISMFSNAYTDVAIDTWSADWDNANVSDIQVEGDDVKLYTSLVFLGIEFTSQTIDASAMTNFHLDIWTPDAIADTTELKIKLVDFGADGAWSGGDDTEHELILGNNILASGSWISLDLPFTDFANLTSQAHLAQLIISGDLNTLYIDNIYFYDRPTSLDDVTNVSSATYRLGNNYPNPFNPRTSISYSLSKSANVSLKVYDVKGRLVETLADGYKSPATHTVEWNADKVASGIYFYSLSVNNNPVETRRMVLLK